MGNPTTIPPGTTYAAHKSTSKTLLIIGIAAISLAVLCCICFLSTWIIGNLLPGVYQSGSSSSSSQPMLAIAIPRANPTTFAYLFIGDAEKDDWFLPGDAYYIEAAGADDTVYTISWQQVRGTNDRVDLESLIRSSVNETDPDRKQELILVANAMGGIRSGMLAFLEAASDGFTSPLFEPSPDISPIELRSIYENYDSVLDQEDAILNAIVALEMRAENAAGSTGCRRVCKPKAGIKESIFEFFFESRNIDRRAVDDILAGVGGMSAEEKMEAWEYIPTSTTGGAQSFDELIIKLQNGELQGEANRIRNSLMDEPAFVATLADIRKTNRPMLQIAYEEGSNLVDKGANMEVEIIKQVLQSSFPGIEEGFDYADKVNEWVELIHTTYENPLEGAAAYASSQAEERINGQIKDNLLEMGYDEDAAGEMADTITGEILNQIVKHNTEEEALTEEQEETEESPEPEKTKTADHERTPTGASATSTVQNRVTLKGSLGITTINVYGYCTIHNDCTMVTNQVQLTLSPAGGPVSGSGILAADVIQPEWASQGVYRATHALLFTGQCSDNGSCRGTGTGDMVLGAINGTYTFTWEGQYFEETFNGTLTSEEWTVEMTLTE